MGRADFKSFDTVDLAFRNSKGKVKPAPELPAGVRVADTHCHLNMLEDPALAIARAAASGVAFLCCITDPAEKPHAAEEDSTKLSARSTYDSVDAWMARAGEYLSELHVDARLPLIRLACGVHPHNARLFEESRDELGELLAHPLTSCLGEIGLDYHYDFSPREVQRSVFAEQLQIAQELNLPVSLHLREAHADALDILRSCGVPKAGCILHCFNLDAAQLAPFLVLGCYIAFGGPLTFKKSWYTRRAALDVPVDRLLTETDAPYMAPEPLRGTVCEPAQTAYTLRTMLDVFGYGGHERAAELLAPRACDLEAGAELPELGEEELSELQAGLDEAAFADCVYRNAVGLLA